MFSACKRDLTTIVLAGYGNIRRAKHAKVVEIAGKWGSLSGKGSGKGGSKGGGKDKRPREDENNLYGKALMALRALYMTKAK